VCDCHNIWIWLGMKLWLLLCDEPVTFFFTLSFICFVITFGSHICIFKERRCVLLLQKIWNVIFLLLTSSFRIVIGYNRVWAEMEFTIWMRIQWSCNAVIIFQHLQNFSFLLLKVIVHMNINDYFFFLIRCRKVFNLSIFVNY